MSTYFDPTPLEVIALDLAKADDLNLYGTSLNASFDLVEADIAAINGDAELWAAVSESWATEAEDVEVEVGKYSSLHWATKSGDSSTEASSSAAGALISENNSAASEASAALDAASTAADVILTNADAASTAADVITTNADAASTAADVISTNADVVSTGIDAASTAADVISTNADVVDSAISAAEALASEVAAAASEANVSSWAVQEINKLLTHQAVDIFLYNTSKDTDGGAWRERCEGLSWYNEDLDTATRGATRKFPAVALIVAEVDKVTIYDATDGTVPMWMVITRPSTTNQGYLYSTSLVVSSISISQGVLSIASGSSGHGLTVVHFLADSATMRHQASAYTFDGLIVERNTCEKTATTSISYLVNAYINDVAMTVEADALIDPATGLQRPTIIVGTEGGVSTIAKDGMNVFDSTITTAILSVVFVDDDIEFVTGTDIYVSPFPTTNGYGTLTYGVATIPAILGGAGGGIAKGIKGSVDGLTHLKENPTTPAEGMVAYTTYSWASGWMHGGIELCLSGNSLTDRSVVATAVSGSATFAPVATGAELEATTATTDLTATVTTGGKCYGWEYVASAWEFREAIGDWVGVSESGGTLTIASGTVFTLLKYTNTTPSAEQIEFIYNDERPLFQEGAKCTLAGTSDAVLALDYDEYTEITTVATSYGHTRFDGLLNIADGATAVGTPTSVSTSGGDIALGGSTAVTFYSPAENLRSELKSQEVSNLLALEPFWFVGDALETDFDLPIGWRPKFIYNAGLLVKDGASDEYVIEYDGFLHTVSFAVAPGSGNDICIMGVLV